MRLQPLDAHRNAVVIGAPLPFGICDAEGRLLLARGQRVDSSGQLQSLLDRGCFVDNRMNEPSAAQKVAQARAEDLPNIWDAGIDQVAQTMRAGLTGEALVKALDECSDTVAALIERDPDLAIFQVIRPWEDGLADYAARHSVHSGIASHMAAHRLGWSSAELRLAMQASVTMNLGMADIQGELATQMGPITAEQRERIRSHPLRSVQALREAGVSNPEWLAAVAQHHEHDDGSGYPDGTVQISDLAALLQRADMYTAKFAPRATRGAMAPDAAARALYQADKGHPMTAALIKEFGIYPPGCYVRLKSGEVAVVTRRGELANAPEVAVIVNRSGEPMLTPLPRRTAAPEYAIVGVVSPASVKVRTPLDKIVATMGR